MQPRVAAALRATFCMSAAAAVIDLFFGLIVAWALTRYTFPGRRLFDAFVDLPFALPTAVAGISLASLYAPNGWFGAPLAELGIKVAFTHWGILVALVFIGLPFVVRSVQPLIAELEVELEEASATLGARRAQTLFRVLLPPLTPALLTGFALAFARAVGEYGSVIFISGNLAYVSEIAPLLIVVKLEQYDYAGATGDRNHHASDLLRLPSGGQPDPGLEPQEVRLCLTPPLWVAAPAPQSSPVGHAGSAGGALPLIGVAIVFLALFLFAPLVVVFSEALSKGFGKFGRPSAIPTRSPRSA